MYKLILKRVIDIVLSTLLMILFSPLFLIIIVIQLVLNRGGVFFKQVRPGQNSRLFMLLKFKTMNDKKDSNGNLLTDKERLTPFGKFLRQTSFDELPQLINVIKGDMSLVGPRPLLVEYLPMYNKVQGRRHEVKPGITGWAQVNGRNMVSWNDKFLLDVYYVDNINLMLDFRILLVTLAKVARGEGISGNGSVTMEKFKGN